MLLAVPEWNKRVSPVFDEALHFRLISLEDGVIESSSELILKPSSPEGKIDQLIEAKVQIVICGAISRYLQNKAEMQAVMVIPFVNGEVDTVIHNWISGELQDQSFMPGCRRRGFCHEKGYGNRLGKRGNIDKNKFTRR
jgi:predicted Fe-Mo cluster-binding NifX family protein